MVDGGRSNRVHTSRRLLLFGVPQGFSPPEKLGRFRQTIDLILQVQSDKKTVYNSNVVVFSNQFAKSRDRRNSAA